MTTAIEIDTRGKRQSDDHPPQSKTCNTAACNVVARDATRFTSFAARTLSRADLDDSFIRNWESLEDRSLEGNVFLSPNLILPALHHLTPKVDPVLIAVESNNDGRRELVGIGIFEESCGSTLLPLPHLRAYRSMHSFGDGLLIDRRCAKFAVNEFFQFLLSMNRRWYGVQFSERSADSELSFLLEHAATRAGAVWHSDSEEERGMLIPSEVPEDHMHEFFSRNRRKVFQKDRRKLEKLGEVKFRFRRCGAQHERRAETFMELEAMGWKGDQGSALLSNPNEAAFFRNMTAGFAKFQRALFAELSVGGVTVFSSSNYISGNTAFAFKVGWHSGFAHASPGSQAELATLANSRAELADLAFVDSCALPGSYIERIWPWRRKITSGIFTTSRIGDAACSTTFALKRFQRGLSRNEKQAPLRRACTSLPANRRVSRDRRRKVEPSRSA